MRIKSIIDHEFLDELKTFIIINRLNKYVIKKLKVGNHECGYSNTLSRALSMWTLNLSTANNASATLPGNSVIKWDVRNYYDTLDPF